MLLAFAAAAVSSPVPDIHYPYAFLFMKFGAETFVREYRPIDASPRLFESYTPIKDTATDFSAYFNEHYLNGNVYDIHMNIGTEDRNAVVLKTGYEDPDPVSGSSVHNTGNHLLVHNHEKPFLNAYSAYHEAPNHSVADDPEPFIMFPTPSDDSRIARGCFIATANARLCVTMERTDDIHGHPTMYRLYLDECNRYDDRQRFEIYADTDINHFIRAAGLYAITGEDLCFDWSHDKLTPNHSDGAWFIHLSPCDKLIPHPVFDEFNFDYDHGLLDTQKFQVLLQ